MIPRPTFFRASRRLRPSLLLLAAWLAPLPLIRAQLAVRQIAASGEDLTAVRAIGSRFVAVGAQGGVYDIGNVFRSNALSFEAGVPLADVHRWGNVDCLVVPAPGSATGLIGWKSSGTKDWEEVRGEAVVGIKRVAGHFVARDAEGFLALSQDLVNWERFAGVPPILRRDSVSFEDRALYQGRYYTWRDGKVMSTVDLVNWRSEFSPESADETVPVFGLKLWGAESVLVAATVGGHGEGPVHLYRKRNDAPWQRLTPSPDWTAVDGIGTAGNWFIAVSSAGQMRVSRDGRFWHQAELPPGFSHRFAADHNRLLLAGTGGRIHEIKPDWDTYVEEPPTFAFATGENWAQHHVAAGNADELLETFQSLARLDRMAAVRVLQQAVALADTSSPPVRLQLAGIITQGLFGISRDPARAAVLLESAAQAGYGPAQLEWIKIVGSGGLGIAADLPRAEALARELVAQSDSPYATPETKHSAAQLLFAGGFGVAADTPRALSLVLVAAEEGWAAAQFDAGRLLVNGTEGVPADPMKAMLYLKQASHAGLPMAAALVGQLYERGIGTETNLSLAATWYQEAVNKGMPQAESALQRVNAALEAQSAAPASPEPAPTLPQP